ncbi:protein BatD [Thalassotalea euphylliae]|uniref:Protein BatD n=1 Tax=Thalassotalea euphylliae TaxID=1655234 RepID=A0A3E0TNN1_9GAMM|nr:BatD family protein [Thalassotalea euphylliae]REL26159.1 protein BatD [Thalassotalea euphylliae]
MLWLVTLITVGLCFSPTSLALSKITASVDKNPVTVKESVVLTIVADDDVDSNALDTSKLLADFIVGRTSVSSQTSMINFNTTRTTTWQTLLIPRRMGNITIPPLTIENQQTDPITLTVLDANDPAASQQRDVFITAQVSNTEVYVQQMLTLTVNIHIGAELKRGSLTEPELEGATIVQVGKDAESDTRVNGKRYRVITRTFSVTPQQSGEFVLRSPMFSGEIMMQSGRRNSFMSFGESKAISVLGDEVPITVKPMPASFSGHWLPSELLTLHEEWQPDTSSGEAFRVGEPITRTITLTAVGVSEEQLPDIELTAPQGIKIYPDQQTTHANAANGRHVSQAVSNFAIVISRPGQYTLPALEVPWFNTVTKRIEKAILPAKTIDVVAGEFAGAFPGEQGNTAPIASVDASSNPITGSAPSTSTAPVTVYQAHWLQWVFLSLWIATSLAWATTELTRRARKNSQSKQISEKNMPVSNAQLALIAACQQQDGHKAIGLLVAWFNQVNGASEQFIDEKGKAVETIAELKQVSQDTALNEAIDELQRYCFSGQACSWSGNALVSAINRISKQQQQKNADALPQLNP